MRLCAALLQPSSTWTTHPPHPTPPHLQVGVKVPLIVRLEGTNVELGKEILARSGLAIVSADNLADAAEQIVRAVKEAA